MDGEVIPLRFIAKSSSAQSSNSQETRSASHGLVVCFTSGPLWTVVGHDGGINTCYGAYSVQNGSTGVIWMGLR